MKQNGHVPRVVVTGIGAITPLGHSWPETWAALKAGTSAGRRITHFDPTDYPTQFACSVIDFDPSKYMDFKEAKRLGAVTHFAWAAIQEAIVHSGLDLKQEDLDRVGLEVGSAFGALDILEEQVLVLYNDGSRRIKPTLAPAVLISTTPAYASIQLGITGPIDSRMSACATGNHSIGDALMYIERGMADVMFAGGTEATITPLGLAGFCAARAMSERNDAPEKASRPFDRGRDGFVAAEGAGILVLEEYEHARRRGARVYAELCGYGATCDANHVTTPAPEGEGGQRAMRMALADAGLRPEQVGYVNTHGTSTPQGDIAECQAIRSVFGGWADAGLVVSSTKSMTGHMLGAAGGAEAVISVLSLHRGVVPPTLNVEEQDPECRLDVVPNVARDAKLEAVLSNSFGFGGTNAVVAFRRV